MLKTAQAAAQRSAIQRRATATTAIDWKGSILLSTAFTASCPIYESLDVALLGKAIAWCGVWDAILYVAEPAVAPVYQSKYAVDGGGLFDIMRRDTLHQAMLPNLSVRIMRDVLAEAGLDAGPAFERAGLSAAIADQPGATVSAVQELDFQRAFVELTARRYELWIKAAHRYTFPTLGIRGLALMTAPTLLDWLRVAKDVDFYYSFHESSVVENDEGSPIGITFDYRDAPPELAEFAIFRDVLVTIDALNYIWQAPIPLLGVHVTFKEGEATTALRGAIRAPVRSRQPQTCVLWSPALSSRPLPLGNDLLFNEYSRQAEMQRRELRLEDSMPEHIVLLLRKPGNAHLDLNGVAEQFHVSVRTLQRRLDKLGVQFRDLRDQARFEEAKAMLAHTALPIAEIAWRLGYAESASFSSAFKRWSNVAPSDYRKMDHANGDTVPDQA